MRRGLLPFIAALALTACANSDTARPLEERIDDLFAAYSQKAGPGYAIAVVSDSELVFANGYGLADIASGTPITAQTSFNIASLSKQFTGAAAVWEIEAGHMALDDKLAEHWPGLPSAYRRIEIGHLVYMTSGLPEYYSLPSPKGGWESEDRFSVEDAISAVFEANRLEYRPGTHWTYSNINYQLLAQLAARRAGTSFADYMEQTFFAPLEMTSTWVDAPIDNDRLGRATSYVWDSGASSWREAPRLSAHYGGSGIFSSLEDLARWDKALYSDKALGEAFTERLLSRRKYAHDKDNDAFGLVHGSYRGLKTVWYEGGDYGVSTFMMRVPERDQTVICLSNIGNGGCGDKAYAVLDLLLAFDKNADFVSDR